MTLSTRHFFPFVVTPYWVMLNTYYERKINMARSHIGHFIIIDNLMPLMSHHQGISCSWRPWCAVEFCRTGQRILTLLRFISNVFNLSENLTQYYAPQTLKHIVSNFKCKIGYLCQVLCWIIPCQGINHAHVKKAHVFTTRQQRTLQQEFEVWGHGHRLPSCNGNRRIGWWFCRISN